GQAQEQQRNRVMEEAQRIMARQQEQERQNAYASLKPRDGGGFTTDSTAALLKYMTPEQLQTTLNLGRDKFKEMQTVTNADGSKGLYSVNEYGSVQNTGLTSAPEIKTQDLGGKVVGLNAYTGQQAWGADKTATIQERESARHNRASEGVAYGNLALSRDRLAFDKQQPRGQVVDTPAGLMLVDQRTGSATPVMQQNGTPLAGKAGEEKALTEGQSKAVLFGSRMQSANETLDRLAQSGVNVSIPGSRNGWGVGSTISAFSSSDRQMLDQAKRDFINAVLRRESGAAIATSEFDNAELQYFPQVGDSAKVIAQKKRNREIAVRGMQAEIPQGQRHLVDSVIGGPAGGGQVPPNPRSKGGATGSWYEGGKMPPATHVDDLLNKYR
ncbi:MAG: hypothetical protein LBV14_17770, partial [Acidovorax sp.]|nr:hypothetical protein [Acidovorax sp.]